MYTNIKIYIHIKSYEILAFIKVFSYRIHFRQILKKKASIKTLHC